MWVCGCVGVVEGYFDPPWRRGGMRDRKVGSPHPVPPLPSAQNLAVNPARNTGRTCIAAHDPTKADEVWRDCIRDTLEHNVRLCGIY